MSFWIEFLKSLYQNDNKPKKKNYHVTFQCTQTYFSTSSSLILQLELYEMFVLSWYYIGNKVSHVMRRKSVTVLSSRKCLIRKELL